MAFQTKLVRTRNEVNRLPLNATTTLLPYCTIRPPMLESQIELIATACQSIPDLAQAATTLEGQQGIRNRLANMPEAAEEMIDFWKEEIIMD